MIGTNTLSGNGYFFSSQTIRSLVMVFMYIHNHSVENCLADKPEQLAKITSQ